MRPRTWAYYWRQVGRSLWRNGWVSVATVAIVAISLFILGAFTLTMINANQVSSRVQSELEVAVFLRDGTGPQEAAVVREGLEALPGVSEVIFIPKEEGLKSLSSTLGEGSAVLSALDGANPLPDYFRVRAFQADSIPEVARLAARLPGVDTVNYGQGVIERLLVVVHWVRWLGLVGVLLLALAAVFLVAITTRLTVYSRQREIAVMKFVGATDSFVSWPFFLEGLVLGLSGAFIAVAALYYSYGAVVANLGKVMPFIPLVTGSEAINGLLLGLIGVGMLLGCAGSGFAVWRYLRV